MLTRIAPKFANAIAASLIACLGVTEVIAQAAKTEEYKPQVGQAGKDVIWVPTPEGLVDRMLRMANVGPNDFVIDLGSGDGRIAIAAAKSFRARARGIEYNPDMVTLSNANAEREGVADRVKFIKADIFESDFSEATVITMYLLPSLNLKLRPRLLDLKPGTRIVAHAFDMGEWAADETATVENRNAYLWIVPAKVGGSWRLDIGKESFDLALGQTFQKLEGTLKQGDRLTPVQGAMRGEEIRVSFADGKGGRRELVGRVNADRMSGKAGAEAFTGMRTAKSGG